MFEDENYSTNAWKASIEQEGAERLEGLTGVDNWVAVSLGKALQAQIDQIARNPALTKFNPDVLSKAILNGLKKFVDNINYDIIEKALKEDRKRDS